MQKRNVITCVLLSIVTCGLYAIFWFYQIISDLYALSGEENKAGMDLLLSVVTCGIFVFYLFYKFGKQIDSIRRNYGLTPRDDSTLFIILSIFGLSIINFCIIQSQLNDELIDAAGAPRIIENDFRN